MEIERKFIVSEPPENLQDYPYHEIEQGYLCMDPVIRIRRMDKQYFLTFKSRGLLSRTECEFPLDKKAYEHQQAILTEEWTNRSADCQVKTPYEALILASIVEREVGRSEDRAIVAGIFSNRLRIKMPLQTDPSVIYGEGETFGGDIKREHLRKDTPYNTYRFVGLPPTPIGNPTRESIHAVLHPAKTDYLYFINKANGDLVPSKTLAEHNRAVRRYILNKGH